MSGMSHDLGVRGTLTFRRSRTNATGVFTERHHDHRTCCDHVRRTGTSFGTYVSTSITYRVSRSSVRGLHGRQLRHEGGTGGKCFGWGTRGVGSAVLLVVRCFGASMGVCQLVDQPLGASFGVSWWFMGGRLVQGIRF